MRICSLSLLLFALLLSVNCQIVASEDPASATAPQDTGSPFSMIVAGGNVRNTDGPRLSVNKGVIITSFTFAESRSGIAQTRCAAIRLVEAPMPHKSIASAVIEVNGDYKALSLPVTLPAGSQIQSVHCNQMGAVAADLLVQGTTITGEKEKEAVLLILPPHSPYSLPFDVSINSIMASNKGAEHSCTALTISESRHEITLNLGAGWSIPGGSSSSPGNDALLVLPKNTSLEPARCRDVGGIDVGPPSTLVLAGTSVNALASPSPFTELAASK